MERRRDTSNWTKQSFEIIFLRQCISRHANWNPSAQPNCWATPMAIAGRSKGFQALFKKLHYPGTVRRFMRVNIASNIIISSIYVITDGLIHCSYIIYVGRSLVYTSPSRGPRGMAESLESLQLCPFWTDKRDHPPVQPKIYKEHCKELVAPATPVQHWMDKCLYSNGRTPTHCRVVNFNHKIMCLKKKESDYKSIRYGSEHLCVQTSQTMATLRQFPTALRTHLQLWFAMVCCTALIRTKVSSGV